MALYADRDFHDHDEEERETRQAVKFLLTSFGLGLLACMGIIFALLGHR